MGSALLSNDAIRGAMDVDLTDEQLDIFVDAADADITGEHGGHNIDAADTARRRLALVELTQLYYRFGGVKSEGMDGVSTMHLTAEEFEAHRTRILSGISVGTQTIMAESTPEEEMNAPPPVWARAYNRGYGSYL